MGSLARALQKAPVFSEHGARSRLMRRTMTRATALTHDLEELRHWDRKAHRVTAGVKMSPKARPCCLASCSTRCSDRQAENGQAGRWAKERAKKAKRSNSLVGG